MRFRRDGSRPLLAVAASHRLCRGVAQPGRALGSGPRGRWFESTRPDQIQQIDEWSDFPENLTSLLFRTTFCGQVGGSLGSRPSDRCVQSCRGIEITEIFRLVSRDRPVPRTRRTRPLPRHATGTPLEPSAAGGLCLPEEIRVPSSRLTFRGSVPPAPPSDRMKI